MNLDDLSRDQFCALVRLYQEAAQVRMGLNQALVVTANKADLDQMRANLSAWASDQNEVSKRASLEIERILGGDFDAPTKLN